jgi:hypothetical protein
MRELIHSVVIALALVVPAIACSTVEEIPPALVEADTVAVDATVELVSVEGGCWSLTVSGSTRLEPVNLPPDFRVNGLKVRARITPADGASACMVGPLVQIIQIQRL